MSTEFQCPRRRESYLGSSPAFARDNDYDPIEDDCRYCGSMNPDTFIARLEAGDISLGTTDKNYKVYVNNAGGDKHHSCKFYFQHLSEEQQERFIQIYNEKRIKFEGGYGFYVLPFFCACKVENQESK